MINKMVFNERNPHMTQQQELVARSPDEPESIVYVSVYSVLNIEFCIKWHQTRHSYQLEMYIYKIVHVFKILILLWNVGGSTQLPIRAQNNAQKKTIILINNKTTTTTLLTSDSVWKWFKSFLGLWISCWQELCYGYKKRHLYFRIIELIVVLEGISQTLFTILFSSWQLYVSCLSQSFLSV
jgi:hypothetical protein